MSKLRTLLVSEKAQGMTEYIIIVALIALVVLAAVKMFGGNLAGLFQSKGEELQKELASPGQ